MNKSRAILAARALLTLALIGALSLIAVTPAQAGIVHGTAPRSSVVDFLGSTDAAKIPTGVTVVDLGAGGGTVSPALGGCFVNELCLWTDPGPGGLLYRWDIGYRYQTLWLCCGSWYLTGSFMQNRWPFSKARAQVTCPNVWPDPTSDWLYGSTSQYESFSGMLINNNAKCIVSQGA